MPSYKSIPRSPRITKECLFDSSRWKNKWISWWLLRSFLISSR
jgi:hypothetical protein